MSPIGAARLLLTLVLVVAAASAAGAVFEPRDFPDAEAEARYRRLVSELRCLVCQNQNLADSNADLAAQLRREVHQMILAGKRDSEITDFMVARYGDFVLYRPPLKAQTILLWLAPFLLGAGGLFWLFTHLRRRPVARVGALSEEERAHLREVLSSGVGDEGD